MRHRQQPSRRPRISPCPCSLLSPAQNNCCRRRLGDRHWSSASASPGQWNKTPTELHLQILEGHRMKQCYHWERSAGSHLGCREVPWLPLGTWLCIEPDHKPLVPLLNSKDVAQMPPRIQRFRLRLMRFNPTVIHVSGKDQITEDALSWAPISMPADSDIQQIEAVTAFAKQAVEVLPASTREEINRNCKPAKTSQCRPGSIGLKANRITCPPPRPPPPLLKQYYTNRGHFSVVVDMLLFDARIVICRAIQLETLSHLHEGHLGITKCRALALTCV